MYMGSETIKTVYTRSSKLGRTHEYVREQTVVLFRCDNCGEAFSRPKGSMSPKRLSNNYFHCCSHCNPKKFAQKKGAERRTIWDKTVNSDLDISRL